MTQSAQSFTPEERRQYIGASELGAILGVDDYKTPLDIYNLKLGLVAPFEGNRHTERGNRLEQVAAEEYMKETGEKLMRRSQEYTHPDYPFIKGHIDRLVVGTDRIAEIKCPSVAAFRKYQREGLPKQMVAQMQAYLGLSGRSEGTWIIFCADQWDMAVFNIEFDAVIYNSIIESAAHFWNDHVLAEKPPKAESADREKIKLRSDSGTITVREDEAFVNAAEALREAATIKKDGEMLFDMAKKDMIKAIGEEQGAYEGGGVRIYYKEQAGRKTFDKKRFEAENPEIDLEPYHKVGNSFVTFRPYYLD